MVVGLLERPVEAPRRRRLLPPARDEETERRRQLDGARLLLERARALVARGWVQDAFYLVRGRRGEDRPVSPAGLLLLSRSDVVAACLVGAVAHASAGVDRRHRRGQAALAVDALHEALTGRPDPAPAYPAARSARVRDLARWNDEPGRTRDEVLDLLDRAVSRTISAAVR